MARVLVACEFSNVVSNAFRELGHDAWSCDLIPNEVGQRWHVQCDVLELIDPTTSPKHGHWLPWDLMVAHPPCTYLCNSGVRWLYKSGRGKVRDEARWLKMNEAWAFFRALWNSGVPRICIENPIPHKYGINEKPTQVIQPWQFGHSEIKATCLWLKNLPPLKPTEIVDGRTPRVHHASPGPDRWKERSRTLPGIAKAMAEQWGALL